MTSAAPAMSMSSKRKMKKTSKYSGMVRVELEKMWNSEAIVVPVIIGGLGSIFHNFINFLKMIKA